MSIIETPAEATKKPARKRRAARASKPSAEPVAKQTVLAGLTITNCAKACYDNAKCVISGSICAHPGKGGLQASLQTPESLRLFNEAKRIIGQNKLDLQNQ